MLLPKEQAENINQILMERMEEDPGPGVPSPLSPRVMKRPTAKKETKTQKPAEDEVGHPKKKARPPSRKTPAKAKAKKA